MYEQTVKSLPLEGRRILNTRTQEQAGTFSSQLSALGAIPVEFPTIHIVAPDDWEPLDNALKRLCEADWYDWLVFTSANGVQIFFERLIKLGYSCGVYWQCAYSSDWSSNCYDTGKIWS